MINNKKQFVCLLGRNIQVASAHQDKSQTNLDSVNDVWDLLHLQPGSYLRTRHTLKSVLFQKNFSFRNILESLHRRNIK